MTPSLMSIAREDETTGTFPVFSHITTPTVVCWWSHQDYWFWCLPIGLVQFVESSDPNPVSSLVSLRSGTFASPGKFAGGLHGGGDEEVAPLCGRRSE